MAYLYIDSPARRNVQSDVQHSDYAAAAAVSDRIDSATANRK